MTTEENRNQEDAMALLATAREMVGRREQLQASAMIWGVVMHALRQVGQKHGWPHESEHDLGCIAGYLSAATGDEAVIGGFEDAEAFHDNFYEDWLGIESVEDGIDVAEKTIEHIRLADAKIDAGARPSNGAVTPAEYYELRASEPRK